MPRPLSEKARQKALDAAVSILTGDGIDGFSLEAVCRHSGVAKTTLYRHWSSTNHLLVAALDCHVESIATPDTGNLYDDMHAMARAALAVMGEPGRRQLMLDLLGAAARDPELAEIQEAMLAERTQPILDIVDRAVARGEIPPIAPDRAISFVHGPLMSQILVRNDPSTEEQVKDLVDLIVRGLGGTPPEA